MLLDASHHRLHIIELFRARITAGKRNKLSKTELESLIDSFIVQLQHAQSAEEIHTLCRAEIALLEEGYKRLTLASIYIPKYRAAIKAAIKADQIPLNGDTSHEYEYQQRVTGKRETRQEHWALTYFKYTPEEYEQLDTRQAQVNRKRLLNLKTVQCDRYLEAIDQLLHSQDKFAARHQAIAIAALTGRRMGEVVARGEFSLTEHPHLLHFTGQQKYERDGYEIITLIPAKYLLEKITEFRQRPEIQAITTLEKDALKETLNKFDVQVNTECHKYLQSTNIVPPLEGKKNVTIHNLRSLWGAIATHFFCPEDHHEYAFLQHYLGHVLKSSATGHYFRYQLTDSNGNILKTKGIKLNTIPPLPLFESEDESPMADQPSLFETKVAESTASHTSEPKQNAIAELEEAWEQRWVEIENRLDILEASTSPKKASIELSKLQKENTRLKTQNSELSQQLEEAQNKLEQFRQLLLGEANPTPTPRPKKEAPAKTTIPDKPTLKATPETATVAETTQKTQTSIKKGRKPGKAVERAKRIFFQVQEWNRSNPDSTFVINPGFLETLFRINRKAAKQFCEEFQAEIWEHHQEIGVENEISHNRGKDVEALLEFVDQS